MWTWRAPDLLITCPSALLRVKSSFVVWSMSTSACSSWFKQTRLNLRQPNSMSLRSLQNHLSILYNNKSPSLANIGILHWSGEDRQIWPLPTEFSQWIKYCWKNPSEGQFPSVYTPTVASKCASTLLIGLARTSRPLARSALVKGRTNKLKNVLVLANTVSALLLISIKHNRNNDGKRTKKNLILQRAWRAVRGFL